MTNDEEIRMLREILDDAIDTLRVNGLAGNAERIEARLARLDAKIEED